MINIKVYYLENGSLLSDTFAVVGHEFRGENNDIYEMKISNDHIVYIPVRNILKIDVQKV